jgi:hypothetical protein
MDATRNSLPLGVLPTQAFSTEQVEMLGALDRADLWFVEERLARKLGFSPLQAQVAILGFKRYMALVGLGYRGLGMVSPEVDEVWHAFILFTKDYADFCRSVFGEFIHHVPRTSRDALPPVGAMKFVQAYREVFGDLPEIWRERIGKGRTDDGPSGCGTEDCTDK